MYLNSGLLGRQKSNRWFQILWNIKWLKNKLVESKTITTKNSRHLLCPLNQIKEKAWIVYSKHFEPRTSVWFSLYAACIESINGYLNMIFGWKLWKNVIKGVKLIYQWQVTYEAQSNSRSNFCKANNEWNTGQNNSDVITILIVLYNRVNQDIL